MPATDTERLILQLSSDLRSFERSLQRAEQQVDRSATNIKRRFERNNQEVTRDFNNFANQARTIIASIGLGIAVREVTQLGDTWTRVGNALAFAGVQTEQLAAVQSVVADIALRTRSDLEATADLFARMLRASEDLGASMADVAAATEIVSKALAGATQSERAGAIRQLGQALAAGVLAGDELRSILENSRVLAEAIANEFGVGVGQLRELGKTGQLESRRVFDAILKAAPEVEAAFARATFTVEDSFVRLRTVATQFVGTNEATSGSVRALSDLIDFLANNFETLADATIIVATAIGGTLAGVAVVKAVQAIGSLTAAAATARLSLGALGGIIGLLVTGAVLLANRFDLFSTEASAAARATDSLYSALALIQNLEPAEPIAELTDVTNRATTALNSMSRASATAAENLTIQERAARGLAEAERLRALNTVEAAIADQRATIAAAQRGIILRNLSQLVGQRPAVREALEAANQRAEALINEARESIALLRDAEAAIRSGQLRPPGQVAAGGRPPAAEAAEAEAQRTRERERQLTITELEAEIERANRLDLRRLENEAELARASGDERSIEAAERRLEIERRIAELRSLFPDSSEGELRQRAEAEVEALEQADLRGRFRDWFSEGVMAALDGDFGDFFENWMRDRAARGLRKALDAVADAIIAIFQRAGQSSGSGSGGSGGTNWWSVIGQVIGTIFSGRASGGPVGANTPYWVGERGKELFVPKQPGVIVPHGALTGAGGFQYVDNRTINFTGTSEELRQLEAAMAADRQARYSETAQMVNLAISRRHIGRRG